MTGDDVLEALVATQRLSDADRCRAVRYWHEILEWAKPDHEGMPISPLELETIRGEIEAQARVNRLLVAALGEAKARRPVHFQLVSEGER